MAVTTQTLSNWRLKDFDLGEGERARAFEAPLDDADWTDIAAPGDVYVALHAAGRLPDALGDRNEDACAWVRDREWWQRSDFDAPTLTPGQRLMLTFEGLDTLATVYLNGDIIGNSDNMFCALPIDVTAKARPGRNRLAVRFTPTSTVETDPKLMKWPIFTSEGRNFVRKAQFGWGWDWGPNLPTVGIWKPVTLAVERVAAIRTVKFTTLELTPDRDRARVSVELEVVAFSGAPLVAFTLTAPDGTTAAAGDLSLDQTKGRVEFELPDPQLWWTPELGAANLYTLVVTLRADGETIAEDRRRVGVRTIQLDQSVDPDEAPATFFRFKLNGVSLFARGACWIPASSFVAEVDEAHYRRLLEPASRANMNMMRVWGGGVYEHDAFYDICDELGMLVWQDFMFACAPYPEGKAGFVASVDAELRFQIERLRNHASLALWCANNEIQILHDYFNSLSGRNDPLQGDLYFREMMPAAVAELDPTTPYWPGSPTGGPVPNSMQAGDVHSWTVWHGIPPIPVDAPVGEYSHTPEAMAYTRYAEDMARFISEYGIHGAPVMETLRRALPEEQRYLDSPGLLNRNKDKPADKMNSMISPVIGLPANLDEYVDFTQIVQAAGLKFGIEHFRRRTPHCSGSLIWQYNDCWPCVSWSLIDYYGFGKASLFYVGRAYAPVMASFKMLDEGTVELWVVNDGIAPVSGSAMLTLHAFKGGSTWSEQVRYTVPATSSAPVWRGQVEGSPGHVLRVTSTDGHFPANQQFFAQLKDLDRAEPVAPDLRLEQLRPNEIAVHVTARAYIWFVHVLVADETVVFSDNYVDVAEGECCTLLIHHPDRAITPNEIEIRWR